MGFSILCRPEVYVGAVAWLLKYLNTVIGTILVAALCIGMFQFLIVSSSAVLASAAAACPAIEKVNPFIGSGGLAYGYGGVNPGAQLPYSPMRLGPDTTNTLANIGLSFASACFCRLC